MCPGNQGGRSFLRRLIDALPKEDNPNFHVKLSSAAREDISWWQFALQYFNGTARFPDDIPVPSFAYATDATPSAAAGFMANDWFYVGWKSDYPEMLQKHITCQELFAVLLSVQRWGGLFSGRHIIVRSDNKATVAAINKSTSKSPDMMSVIRQMFWISVACDLRLTAQYIPGVDNVMADRLSRLSEPKCAIEAAALLGGEGARCFAEGHMSHASFSSLQAKWGSLTNS